MYIYKIVNNLNHKVYIGQTIGNVKARWRNHVHPKSGGGRSAIKEAIQKYGKNNFIFEVIDTASTQDELNIKERNWITLYNSLAPNGYNLRSGGQTGHKYSLETRKKMSEKKLGQPPWNKNSKPLTATALDGSYSISFLGNKQAEECGFDRSTIHDVVSGEYKQYLGLTWEHG